MQTCNTMHYVVSFHITHPDRVGEGKGDSEGKTLRHGHHQNRHTNNEVVHIVTDVTRMPRLLVDHKVCDTVAKDEDHHSHHSDYSACKQTWIVRIITTIRVSANGHG